MQQAQKNKPKSLLDLATDNYPMSGGMTLDEALKQVDRLNNGDKELKSIIREAYGATAPKQ